MVPELAILQYWSLEQAMIHMESHALIAEN